MTRFRFFLLVGLPVLFAQAPAAWAAAPTLGAVVPVAGKSSPDQEAAVSSVYSDADGWSTLTDLRFLINTSTGPANALYLRYDRVLNKLYLLNDAGTAWLGGVAPGSAVTLENSLGRLVCAKTTVSGSGANLTLSWQINFKSAAAGKTYNVYLWAKDNLTAVGWTQKGTWLVDGTPPTTPVVTDDGAFTASVTQLHAKWSSADPETGIAEYQYQITRDSGAGPVVVLWTSAGTAAEITRSGLSLTQGVSYFFSVKARNGVGRWSVAGLSNGIAADRNPPLIGSVSPADGSTYVEGDSVSFAVSASDADGDPLQIQFLLDGTVRRPWSSSPVWAWGTAGVVREHSVTVQVRDPYGRQAEQTFKLFGYRRPKGAPSS